MIVQKAQRVDVECIVRGYIPGSMWKEYKTTRAHDGTRLHNIDFTDNLKGSDKPPRAIFTPSAKAKEGHDISISYEKTVEMIGPETAQLCRDKSLEIHTKGAEFALTKGLIIADTKFEFGFDGDAFILIDEALTPDLSRFWPVDQYQPGRSQPSFDKQIVRDYLDTLDWDKTASGPKLPDEIVEKTRKRYQEVVARLTE